MNIVRFYNNNTKNKEDLYNEYKNNQIKRCLAKISKKRGEIYYKTVSDNAKDIIKEKKYKNMICLGSRNNWEKTILKKYLDSLEIFDLDICEKSNCDYTYDFQKLPDSFLEKWNIIFTNSLDHSINPIETVNYWYNYLSKNGLLIIGYEPNVDENHISFGKYDCSTLPLQWHKNLDNNKLKIVKEFTANAGENSDHIYHHIILYKL